MVQAGVAELLAGMLVSEPGRTVLFQVVFFVGLPLVFLLFLSVPLISGSWFHLTSLSGIWIILSSAFFSFASPAALVWMPGSGHHLPFNHL